MSNVHPIPAVCVERIVFDLALVVTSVDTPTELKVSVRVQAEVDIITVDAFAVVPDVLVA